MSKIIGTKGTFTVSRADWRAKRDFLKQANKKFGASPTRSKEINRITRMLKKRK